MMALILIGGEGTRLRPFTCDYPKPLLPVVNRPFLEYQLENLKRQGVRDVALCTAYKPSLFHRLLGNGKRLGMRLSYAHETRPLGTGGAVKNAHKLLKGTVLILNGDVLHNLDVRAFLAFHRKSRAELSISLTRVKDPTLYGSVVTDASGRIQRFLEKPSWDEITTNTINAGAYLFEPSVFERIPPGIPYSLERALFPHMLEEGARLFAFVSRGYWMDIGTVEKYLQVHLDALAGEAPVRLPARRRGICAERGAKLGRHVEIDAVKGLLVLGQRARVADYARFSGRVCVGPDCVIGRGASLEDCVVLSGARIGDGASLRRCVVGPDCRVGAHALLSEGAALAGGSKVGAYCQL